MRYFPLIIFSAALLAACTSHPDVPSSATASTALPAIYPDYTNVTVPSNIAPLNFMLSDETYDECVARITTPDGSSVTYGEGRKVIIPESDWHDILATTSNPQNPTTSKPQNLKTSKPQNLKTSKPQNPKTPKPQNLKTSKPQNPKTLKPQNPKTSKPHNLIIEVWGKKDDHWTAFRKFNVTVAPDTIDPYISYRLIEPSYLIYDFMEINQRDMTSFDETTIFNNKVAADGKGQCINCHSYQNYKTDNMLFHVRANNGGTVIVNDGKLSKVDLKRDNTISAGVYPAWHPSEKLIAFSTNTTRQLMHTVNPNKTEVFDLASDLILYDVAKDDVTIVSNDTTRLEVFPAWSPDGKYLYYCSTLTDTVKREIRDNYQNVRYNLYRRSFDAATRQFGSEQLIYDAVSLNRSVSLPRISPDGRHILFAEGSYGCFNIWHHDADIRMITVPAPGAEAEECDITPLNSNDNAESYPSWSSTGKWIMCASRRDDGNYSRVYISYYDGKKVHKAFELPQADPEYNRELLKSYNRPEFMIQPVTHTITDFKQVVVK